MRRIFFVTILLFLFIVTGCGKKQGTGVTNNTPTSPHSDAGNNSTSSQVDAIGDENVSTSSPMATQESGTQDTKDWQTYKNEEYGFEFRFYDEYENYKDKFLTKVVGNDAFGENENCIFFYDKKEMKINYDEISTADHVNFAIYPYNKMWFKKNSELVKEYNSDVKDDVEVGYLKGKRGLQGNLGICLGENDNYVFFIKEFLDDSPANAEYLELRMKQGIKRMVIDSFKVD